MICTKSLFEKPIEARDGHVGLVQDLYFDDLAWKVRYLVVKTGNWLSGRTVLISPQAIVEGWHGKSGVSVNLTKDQVKASPLYDSAQPVSRRAEQLLNSHYGWSPYWAESIAVLRPDVTLDRRHNAIKEAERAGDPHLGCGKEVLGYRVLATDGDGGQLKDLVIHEDDSSVSFLAIKLKKHLGGGKAVLIRPCCIETIDWAERRIVSNLSCQSIECSPEYVAVP